MNRSTRPTITLGGNFIKNKQNNQLVSSKKSSSPIVELSSAISKPIMIRYIDPRIVPLMVELGKLSQMVQQFAVKAEEVNTQTSKEDIQELIKSSKDLSAKVSTIVEENDIPVASKFEETSSFHKNVENSMDQIVKEELCFQAISTKAISEVDTEDLDMVEVLSKVSIRMDELQQENAELRESLQTERQKNQHLSQQKQQLQSQVENNRIHNIHIISQLEVQLSSRSQGETMVRNLLSMVTKNLKYPIK